MIVQLSKGEKYQPIGTVPTMFNLLDGEIRVTTEHTSIIHKAPYRGPLPSVEIECVKGPALLSVY